ncbi:hypothetical protein PENSPDRAFT_355330 [Peniophora sp. CONT]|nr:hypothetical protein PENSPDRAFT_355330 [Peniophora sp. CONT]
MICCRCMTASDSGLWSSKSFGPCRPRAMWHLQLVTEWPQSLTNASAAGSSYYARPAIYVTARYCSRHATYYPTFSISVCASIQAISHANLRSPVQFRHIWMFYIWDSCPSTRVDLVLLNLHSPTSTRSASACLRELGFCTSCWMGWSTQPPSNIPGR